jgi:ferritin-like protein
MTEEIQELKDEKLLKEMEELWSEWVIYEKNTITKLHSMIGFAKGIIQNPHKSTTQEIKNHIKTINEMKEDYFENNKLFDNLNKKTIQLAMKTISIK